MLDAHLTLDVDLKVDTNFEYVLNNRYSIDFDKMQLPSRMRLICVYVFFVYFLIPIACTSDAIPTIYPIPLVSITHFRHIYDILNIDFVFICLSFMYFASLAELYLDRVADFATSFLILSR